MMLEKHVNSCPECAAYAKEMNCCLDLLCELKELSPSENFEWNLKRAILQEKTRRVRLADALAMNDMRWGIKFVASAASVAAIVLVGVWLVFRSPSGVQINSPSTDLLENVSSRPVQLTPRDYSLINFTSSGYKPTGVVRRTDPYVNAQPLFVNASGQALSMSPIQFATSSREDSLMAENQFLWRRLESLEREVMVMQRLLSRELTRRR
jgi:hypothetical protein